MTPNVSHFFIQPLDVLHFRGNRLFAEAGHSDPLMPPWPSVFAGALRTRLLVSRGVAFDRFKAGEMEDQAIANSVGRSPSEPGDFAVTFVGLGKEDGQEAGNVYVPAPHDLSLGDDGIHRLEPVSIRTLGLDGSFPLPFAPVLKQAEAKKAAARPWLTLKGLEAHLRREPVGWDETRSSADLWKTDSRLGIALAPGTRTAEQGMLYTSDAVALKPDFGFVVGVAGLSGLDPSGGLIRLGGDGRAASIAKWPHPLPNLFQPGENAFRMILATPGWFNGSWLPLGLHEENGAHILDFDGLRARLVAACVPRAEIVSGWDIANKRPKPAELIVPAGSVYWFEKIEGSTVALRRLFEDGLWPLMGDSDAHAKMRRAEGFNRVWFGR